MRVEEKPTSELQIRPRTQTKSPSLIIARTRTLERQDQSDFFIKFKALDLENEEWYRDLGRLTFIMAIAVAGDILF
jgi:hypothetical protein